MGDEWYPFVMSGKVGLCAYQLAPVHHSLVLSLVKGHGQPLRVVRDGVAHAEVLCGVVLVWRVCVVRLSCSELNIALH
jgi:hypothetical protein